MEHSKDEKENKEYHGLLVPDDNEQSASDTEMPEECASVQAAETGIDSSVHPNKMNINQSSGDEDVILCISDSDSEDSVLEVLSPNQLTGEVEDEEEPQPTEQPRVILPLPPLYRITTSANTPMRNNSSNLPLPRLTLAPKRHYPMEVASIVSSEEPPGKGSEVSFNSPQETPLEADPSEIFEISDDEEMPQPASVAELSIDLTGDSSDEESNPPAVDKSTDNSVPGAASEQVPAPLNEDDESMGEQPTEDNESQLCCQSDEPAGDNHNASQPTTDINVPSGDGPATTEKDQKQRSTEPIHTGMDRETSSSGGAGGDGSGNASSGTSSTTVALYRQQSTSNRCRSGLPNYNSNNIHFLDKLLAALYPKFHTVPLYTKTRGGFEYTRLLQLDAMKKRKTKQRKHSPKPSKTLLKSPFYDGPTRYGGASALPSNRDSRLLQILARGRQDAPSTSAGQYHRLMLDSTTPLMTASFQALRHSVPEETYKLDQSAIRSSSSARSRISPYTITKQTRVPMAELVIPTVGQLLQYKRQLAKETPSVSEEVTGLDADKEAIDNTTSVSNVQSKADITSAAGNFKLKQITKIKPAITRTRTSTVTSGSGLFAPAPRYELPNVALPGLTSLPKLDVPPEFGFGPGSSQPVWKKMSSVDQSERSEKQQQHSLEAAAPSSAPFQFNHPEILGSWTTENMYLSSSGPSIMFDFAAPVPLEDDSISETAVFIAQSDSEPPTTLVPLAQLAKVGAGKWECPTCMVFNELSNNRCVACECPQPKVKEAAGTAAMKLNQSSAAAPAADFKYILSTQAAKGWECQDCFVRNAQTQQRCVCCGATPKVLSGSQAAALPAMEQHQFADNVRASSDDFKALVQQQKSGKWECSTCLTRNDETTVRCVCCEQPKTSTVKQPLVASSETSKPTVVHSAGYTIATHCKENNPTVSKPAFLSPAGFSFGNADKFTVDNRAAQQTKFGRTSAMKTIGTKAHTITTSTVNSAVSSEQHHQQQHSLFKNNRFNNMILSGAYQMGGKWPSNATMTDAQKDEGVKMVAIPATTVSNVKPGTSSSAAVATTTITAVTTTGSPGEASPSKGRTKFTHHSQAYDRQFRGRRSRRGNLIWTKSDALGNPRKKPDNVD